MLFKKFQKVIFLVGTFFFLFTFVSITQAATTGEVIRFYIDSSYDISGRGELIARLVKTTPELYFYIDNTWWSSQTSSKQQEILEKLTLLSNEFETKIYPTLTSIFGKEWKPGIDGDEKISVLLHPMQKDAGGYFRTIDEYLKVQFPESNEREMFYLNTQYISNPRFKGFLAHEFLHLITFNQKDKIHNVTEETWLNEARAEAAVTLLGYDDSYEGSNLQKRVKDFLKNPSDSLTEWLNKDSDYGSVNLFIQYLLDHYGVSILADSLKSKEIGIASINQALKQNGFEEDFSQIFTDWTIAVLVNDCNLDSKYCYLNKNLKNVTITPAINFLPLTGKSTLTVTNITKNWSGNWYKFIGGKGILKLEFTSLAGLNFRVPYLVQNKEGKYSISFLVLDENQKGQLQISDFSTGNLSLIIIPSLQTKVSDFDGVEPTYPFTFSVSILERTPEEEQALIQKLLKRIEELKKEIARVQAEINAILASRGQGVSCGKFERNLYFGITNSVEVKCLQEFLKNQGTEIYPEGLITGNFLALTEKAVIRFQEKYADEILKPLGLERGTGFFGSMTRTKANQLLGF